MYLFHWHPAKSQFEWRTDLDIKHSFSAVLAGQYFANFFIRQGKLVMSLYSSFLLGKGDFFVNEMRITFVYRITWLVTWLKGNVVVERHYSHYLLCNHSFHTRIQGFLRNLGNLLFVWYVLDWLHALRSVEAAISVALKLQLQYCDLSTIFRRFYRRDSAAVLMPLRLLPSLAQAYRVGIGRLFRLLWNLSRFSTLSFLKHYFTLRALTFSIFWAKSEHFFAF